MNEKHVEERERDSEYKERKGFRSSVRRFFPARLVVQKAWVRG